MISTLDELKSVLQSTPVSIAPILVVGLFREHELQEEVSETYSISAWGQFQAAADSLRGPSRFMASSNAEVLSTFGVIVDADGGTGGLEDKLPAVYLIAEDRNRVVQFNGDILEQGLAEWVLRYSTPPAAELSLKGPGGEIYATQFFSARKLKFILFLQGGAGAQQQREDALVSSWLELAEKLKGQALFSFMRGDAVPDVTSYFDVSVPSDVPVIVAHDPGHDWRYKSAKLPSAAAASITVAADFVADVLRGTARRILKSESAASAASYKKKLPKTSAVVYATGSTVVDIVGQEGKDVLLLVTGPKCEGCRKLLPTLDLLAKAVAGEPRIVIAKIDGGRNDVPAAWVRGQSFPLLLWFPASDKGSRAEGEGESEGESESEGKGQREGEHAPGARRGDPTPRAYWDAGTTLHALVSFVQRKSSFELASLRVATNEQLNTLLGEEETLEAHYLELHRVAARNEGRVVLEGELLDWAAGEIVFDGKRWHLLVALVLAVYFVVSLPFLNLTVGVAKGGSGSSGGVAVSKVKGENKKLPPAAAAVAGNAKGDNEKSPAAAAVAAAVAEVER